MAGYNNKSGHLRPASILIARSKPFLCTIFASCISTLGWAQSQASDMDNFYTPLHYRKMCIDTKLSFINAALSYDFERLNQFSEKSS